MRAVSSASAAAGATSTAILGGGIGGLSAAYYLARAATAAATTHSTTHSHPPSSAPHSITLYETARRLGGWIGTEQNAAHGLRFERGPRTIRPVGERGANTLRMCADLQLDEQLIAVSRSHIAAQNRMIYANGALHSLPSSLGSLFRRLPPFSRPLIAAAWHDVRTGRSGGATLRDESIYDFAERRFGAETAKYLVSSMICGICAGDARQISVRFLMAELFEQEQRHGGVLKGWLYGKLFGGAKAKAQAAETAAAESRGLLMEAEHCGLVDRAAAERWSVYSFREGLEQLPQRLAERVERQGVSIERGADAQALWMEEDGRVSVTLGAAAAADDGAFTTSPPPRRRSFDHVVSGLPANRLAPLLAAQHPQLAAELAAIPYVDVALVNLQYEGDALLQRPGFGFLVPPSEQLPILGVIFDSCCFPQPGKTVLTVMMGGAWFAERLGERPTNRQLHDIAVTQVATILGIRQRPQTGRVHVLQQCIPQYVVGHAERVQRIRAYVRERRLPLTLCGAAYDGVGVNDVIWSARAAAAELQGMRLWGAGGRHDE